MKVIVTGTRTFNNYDAVARAIVDFRAAVTEVVSGAAPGVDVLGELWARRHGIPIKRFTLKRSRHGDAADSARNAEMVEYAEGLIAVWDGVNPSVEDLIEKATERGLLVDVHFLPKCYGQERMDSWGRTR